ncbi:MAG: rhomboid family intramembrane serine protease [Aquabacterium sp.]|uniref:rhomboid family intramembrane serine protease n=1 Tax=Aquabacterium sp. TaxID=1872578 RepID=UPI0025BF2F53|nr:rhomboid family intramembrane serine protease [Aquabacterium sp.]MBI5926847.1 rhomboid family intramembrane serine protease [Aquabacterium sp.]
MPPLPPITQALILINVAMFCLDDPLNGLLTHYFALYPIQSGFFYPWQVVSYAFLHGSLAHIFFNMMGLWMFGSELERVWGSRRYMEFLLASVLTAAAAQLILSLLAGWSNYTVGASGGIYGLLLAFGMMFPNRTIMPLFPPIPMKAKVFVAVFGGLELLQGVMGTSSGVAHFAHLGGMLGGWLMLRYWRGQPPFKPRRGPRRF